MKKSFIIVAVTLGAALMLTSCSGNTGTETSDDIADTRIGKIDNLSDWEEALGDGSITAVFTLAD